MKFPAGDEHPAWKGGRSLTSKGYVRIKSGKNRDKFEHRVVMEELIECSSALPPGFSRGSGIPVGFEIHHFDRNRSHNCVGNLMFLQDVIHHAIAKKREHLPWYAKHRKKQGLPALKKVTQ